MNKTQVKAGAIFGALAVILGAYGAHGLLKVTSDESIIHGFDTGVKFQFYHALALLATGIISKEINNRFIRLAGILFIIGTLLFSGSLYLLAFLKIQGSDLTKIAGPLTPVGGLFFVAGWVLLVMGISRK